MKVLINPNPHQRGTGIMSSFRWSHPKMQRVLEILFDVQEYERIVSVEVDEEGITARFENKDEEDLA